MTHVTTRCSQCYITQMNGNDVEHKTLNELPIFNKGMCHKPKQQTVNKQYNTIFPSEYSNT